MLLQTWGTDRSLQFARSMGIDVVFTSCHGIYPLTASSKKARDTMYKTQCSFFVYRRVLLPMDTEMQSALFLEVIPMTTT